MSDLDFSVWDGLADHESEARHARVTALRVATAGVWPFLAQASDRDDFVNRLELVRPRLQAEAAKTGDETLGFQVEAAYVNDFEVMLQARAAAAPRAGDAGPKAPPAPKTPKRAAVDSRIAPPVQDQDLVNHLLQVHPGTIDPTQIPPEHLRAIHDWSLHPGHTHTHEGSGEVWSGSLSRYVSRKQAVKGGMTYHEMYGDVSRPQLAAYRKYNVSPSDHDEMVNHFGEDAHDQIVEHVKRHSQSGMYNPRWGWQRDASLDRQAASYSNLSFEADKAPYYTEQKGDKWVVVNKDGEVKGTHDSKGSAREQQKAMYANIPDASEKAEKAHGKPKPKAKSSAWDPTASQRLEALYNQGFEFEGALECPACPETFFNETERLSHMASHKVAQGDSDFGDDDGDYDDDGGFNPGMTECPACGGPAIPLGTLGNRTHYRCRNCGMDHSPANQRRHEGPHWTGAKHEGSTWDQHGQVADYLTKRKPGPYSNYEDAPPDVLKRLDPDEYDAWQSTRHGKPKTSAQVCPSCGNAHMEDDSRGGKRCPACGNTHTQAQAVAKKGPIQRIRQVVAERNPTKKPCPYCGKMIDVKRMAHHIEEDHPHQAVPLDMGEGSEKKEKGKGRKHEGAAGNPYTPDDTTDQSGLTGQSARPGTMPTPDPTTGPDTDPSTISRTSAQAVIDKIAMDLYGANPGLTEPQRIHLATETLRRFPGLVSQARGGADYVDGETLTGCPQCGKQALNNETGACHNCGYQQKPGA